MISISISFLNLEDYERALHNAEKAYELIASTDYSDPALLEVLDVLAYLYLQTDRIFEARRALEGFITGLERTQNIAWGLVESAYSKAKHYDFRTKSTQLTQQFEKFIESRERNLTDSGLEKPLKESKKPPEEKQKQSSKQSQGFFGKIKDFFWVAC